MNSRAAFSALLILMAAMVLASEGTDLVRKIKVLQASWADKVAETQSLLDLYRTCHSENQPRPAGITSPSPKTISFNFPNATHLLFAGATPATTGSETDRFQSPRRIK